MTHDQRLGFERTARDLEGELRRAARRLAKTYAHADDLVQETLLRALAVWHRVEPGSNPRAFLHAILRNTFINDVRRRSREVESVEEPVAPDDTGNGIVRLDLLRALAELPEPLLETLLAVDLEGLAYREAAARAGTPVGTVMSRLHRARRRVAHKLAA
jgi:RNA polymerase sigma-70 factor (ECF subfamily)